MAARAAEEEKEEEEEEACIPLLNSIGQEMPLNTSSWMFLGVLATLTGKLKL